MSIKSKIKKWIDKLIAKATAWIDEQERAADAAREAETEGASVDYTPVAVQAAQEAHDALYEDTAPGQPATPATEQREKPTVRTPYAFGLASCWAGSNASKRMMNVLSPKMSDSTFKDRLKHMTDRGCDVAHLILANTADGEAGGYAAWKDSDQVKMKERWNAVKAAGLTPIPWLVTDDSDALASDLFSHAEKHVKKMADAGFFEGVPLVVLGLEMNETYGSDSGWKSLRTALRKYYTGPIGVHHKSGNDFPYAKYGEVILGQLNPGCTTSQVKSQVKAILKLGKRAIGFEYSRGPDRSLCLAALEAGAEGVGNWDGGSVPSASTSSAPASTTAATSSASSNTDDAVDYSLLQWSYGGFKGGSAKLATRPRIYNLSVTSKGLSYKWMQGGCTDLGCSSATDANCLACLFVLVGGKWVGGKFDWISTSRLTRDFANISGSGDNPGGYNGWPKDSIGKAEKYAFVIVSKDGKSRTNVITCKR